MGTNQNIRKRFLLVLSIFLLSFQQSCVTKHPNKYSQEKVQNNILTNTIWSFRPTAKSADSCAYQPFYFRNKKAFLGNREIARFSIKRDTLRIEDYCGVSQSSLSDFKKEKTVFFIGKLEEVNQDSLIIEKIDGKEWLFCNEQHLLFLNDELSYNKNLHLEKISYSNSSGLTIQIMANGDYKYFGSDNTKKPGNYTGIIKKEYFGNIQEEFRIAEKLKNCYKRVEQMDGLECEIFFSYNKNQTMKIEGCPAYFSPRLHNIEELIRNSILSVPVTKSDSVLEFETTLHRQIKLPPPPPRK